MNKNEYLLSCISEECNEVGKQVSKILRFGGDDIPPNSSKNNTALLIEEITDLVAVIELYFNQPITNLVEDEAVLNKITKLQKWMEYSKTQGTLT